MSDFLWTIGEAIAAVFVFGIPIAAGLAWVGLMTGWIPW